MAADPRLPELMDDKDVADYLDIAVYTVQQYVREGRLGCIQRGKIRRYTVDHVLAYLKANERPATVELSRGQAEGRLTRHSPKARVPRS